MKFNSLLSAHEQRLHAFTFGGKTLRLFVRRSKSNPRTNPDMINMGTVISRAFEEPRDDDSCEISSRSRLYYSHEKIYQWQERSVDKRGCVFSIIYPICQIRLDRLKRPHWKITFNRHWHRDIDQTFISRNPGNELEICLEFSQGTHVVQSFRDVTWVKMDFSWTESKQRQILESRENNATRISLLFRHILWVMFHTSNISNIILCIEYKYIFHNNV